MFLREDIQDLVRVQHHEATAAAHKNTSTSSSSHHSKAAANPKSSDYAAAKGTKPLTAFFSAKSKGS